MPAEYVNSASSSPEGSRKTLSGPRRDHANPHTWSVVAETVLLCSNYHLFGESDSNERLEIMSLTRYHSSIPKCKSLTTRTYVSRVSAYDLNLFSSEA